MPQCIAAFPDGVEAELSVYTPWWTWLYLGLIDQPTFATVRIYRKAKKSRQSKNQHRQSSTQTVAVEESVTADISINAVIWQSRDARERLVDNGTKSCLNVSSCTKVTHRIGFPRPAWAGGGTIKGIGYNVLVQRNTQSVSLQCHAGSKYNLPETHICR